MPESDAIYILYLEVSLFNTEYNCTEFALFVLSYVTSIGLDTPVGKSDFLINSILSISCLAMLLLKKFDVASCLIVTSSKVSAGNDTPSVF